MKRPVQIGISILIVGLVLSITFGISRATTDDEAAVREVLAKSASSFAKKDMAAASQVWANDESLTVFESGHANYGWADYRDNHLGPEMKEMQNTNYTLSDMTIHLAGNTAWATMKYSIAADLNEAGTTRHVQGAGLATAVLEKRSDVWRIVHWHSSAPRRAPSTTPSATPTAKFFAEMNSMAGKSS